MDVGMIFLDTVRFLIIGTPVDFKWHTNEKVVAAMIGGGFTVLEVWTDSAVESLAVIGEFLVDGSKLGKWGAQGHGAPRRDPGPLDALVPG
jgi:hypothetical protein